MINRQPGSSQQGFFQANVAGVPSFAKPFPPMVPHGPSWFQKGKRGTAAAREGLQTLTK